MQENSRGRVSADGEEAGETPSSPLVYWWSDGGVVAPTATFVMELATLTQGMLISTGSM